MSAPITHPQQFLDVHSDAVEWLVDMGPVPICESQNGCDRQAMWTLRKVCKCQLLLCEPCRVQHWNDLQAIDAGDEWPEEMVCLRCRKWTQLDPFQPLYWQLIASVLPL